MPRHPRLRDRAIPGVLLARATSPHETVVLRTPGRVDYAAAFDAMRVFTDTRSPRTPDEIWLLEHRPVFTMGLKGRGGARTHIRDIPLVYTDRGGDITYHGPGQWVAYVLMDLERRGWGAKRLVQALEQAIIQLLASHQIRADRRAGAPGVYVAGAKIASLGLRVRRGCSYHGIAFNVDMDLAPFSWIDPCGYPGQPVTQLVDLGIRRDLADVGRDLLGHLTRELGYTGSNPGFGDLPRPSP
ncbi:MAG: lipoyl(octanoyl) transferase LipB [Bacteroidota bacterium]